MKKAIILALIGALVAPAVVQAHFKPAAQNEFAGPAAVTQALAKAFSRADIKALQNCLAPDFTFYFNELDVATVVARADTEPAYNVPPKWTYQEFILAVGEMLTSVDFVVLSFQADKLTPTADATTFEAKEVPVRLSVMFDTTHGADLTNVTADLAFENAAAPGAPAAWRLKSWRDNSHGAGGAEMGYKPASIGQLFAAYH